MRSFQRLFLSLLLVAGSSVSLFGQTDTARLIGTITDPSGAVIPNAAVIVTNTGTGRAVTIQTSGSGEYTVTALSAGKYHIEVKASGFKTSTADFTLEVSQVQEISLKLETGATATTVDVTSDVPLVDTATSSVGEVIQGRTDHGASPERPQLHPTCATDSGRHARRVWRHLLRRRLGNQRRNLPQLRNWRCRSFGKRFEAAS